MRELIRIRPMDSGYNDEQDSSMGNKYPSWKIIAHAEEKDENTHPHPKWFPKRWAGCAASILGEGGYFSSFCLAWASILHDG